MTCAECLQLLSEFRGEKLAIEEAKAVRGHLANCPRCAAELRVLAEIESLAGRLKRHEPNPDVVMQISQAIHASAPSRHRTDFGPVMDIEDLAEFLRVTVDVIEDYLDEIPCFELGGKLLFSRSSIEKWIGSREVSFAHQIRSSKMWRLAGGRGVAQGGVKWTA